MAAHFGRDLVQLQQELHRMKVATKEQVDNIEITREVNIILNISLSQNTTMFTQNDPSISLYSLSCCCFRPDGFFLLWSTKEDIFNSVVYFVHTMKVKKQ